MLQLCTSVVSLLGLEQSQNTHSIELLLSGTYSSSLVCTRPLSLTVNFDFVMELNYYLWMKDQWNSTTLQRLYGFSYT